MRNNRKSGNNYVIIENQITNYNTANKEKGKYDLLHLDIMQLSSEILVSLKELLENFYSINSKS